MCDQPSSQYPEGRGHARHGGAHWSTATCAAAAAGERGRVAPRCQPAPRAPAGHPRAERRPCDAAAACANEAMPARDPRPSLGATSDPGPGTRLRPRLQPGRSSHRRRPRGGCLAARCALVRRVAQPAPSRRSTRALRTCRAAWAQDTARTWEWDSERANRAVLTQPTGCGHIVVLAAPPAVQRPISVPI